MWEQINTSIVKSLINRGIYSVGLSGAHNKLLLCNYLSKKHGYVGQIKAVNVPMIESILFSNTIDNSPIPVIASIGVDDFRNYFKY